MALSILDLFSIGIGPSSSHTVGPMRAANRFLLALETATHLPPVSLEVHLYGSLALTGKGHATDKAIMLGLSGYAPDQIEPDQADRIVANIRDDRQIILFGRDRMAFSPDADIIFHFGETLPFHPNGMRLVATGQENAVLFEETYYSIGGGFVLSGADTSRTGEGGTSNVSVRHPFQSARELLEICADQKITIAELALRNEAGWRTEAETRASLLSIWAVMEACIKRGCEKDGILPGGLGVKRRARKLHEELSHRPEPRLDEDPLAALDWVNLFALAVNEENAAGGRVVTAPTNGAAGVIPAVLSYYRRFTPNADEDGVVTFLLTAGVIGYLFKKNASISAAEMGCQGEIGVACSMAAAGLCAVLGGTSEQIENAAEIGLEHNLGLTCDPVGGLVQIPCIERNTMGAVKAINAARLALKGDGSHFVPLDQAIETMRQTGHDMSTKYKETSLGGLAVNVVAC